MQTPLELFRAILKEADASVTQARIAVFTALSEQAEPVSMQQLVGQARGVDRASVYRAVELFERLGIVHRITMGWKYKLELTDRFLGHHHHLSCVECGQTTAINEIALEQFVEKLAHAHGFLPSAHQIEIQGVCRRCREEKKTPLATSTTS